MFRRVFLLCILCITSHVLCDERSARVKRIVGGVPAPAPPPDDPVVYTRFNGNNARVEGGRDYPHYVFKGIRYAYSPTKRERFLRPREYFLNGYVNATAFPPPCVQPDFQTGKIIGDEDCLFLNIFTPELPTGLEGLPVVVWIHGGGYRIGSASQYGVRHLVAQRIIIVTIQYRLGSLGFLTSESQELPGNAALWDMALAVQWVRNYIGFFGGNPYRIVVMGQGTGGSGALLVTLSNISKGLAGVIAMSGSAVSNWAVENTPTNTAWKIAESNGCPNTSVNTMIRCLQNVPAQSIIESDREIDFQRQQRGFVTSMSGRSASAPRLEGEDDRRSLPRFIQREPIEDLSAQHNPKIPLLTGITKDETKRAVEVQYKDEIINKLKTVPDFLEEVVIKGLQDTVSFKNFIRDKLDGLGAAALLGNLGNFDPSQVRNYVKSTTGNVLEELGKIADATADALFNLPAFLTADLWSKSGTPAFLYSFEHSGKAKKGYSFLRGLPLVGSKPPEDDLNGTVCHGDDLAYLFDAHDIYGNPLDSNEDQLTEEDVEVRNVYTKMIADFARYGKVSIGKDFVNPFSTKDNNFIQIKPKPKVVNGFKYCEMGLWLGLADRLKSQSCSFLGKLQISSIFGNGNNGGTVNGLGKLTDLGKTNIMGKDILGGKIMSNTASNGQEPGMGSITGKNIKPAGEINPKSLQKQTKDNADLGLGSIFGRNLMPSGNPKGNRNNFGSSSGLVGGLL